MAVKPSKYQTQEIMLKNKSYFKTSTGDEAGCATPAKKGIVTGKIKGKLYFTAWSMDVKAEGKNVVRHLDIATHNHASVPGNTLVWPYLDQMSIALDHPCVKDMKKEHEACKDYLPNNPEGKSACEEADKTLIQTDKGDKKPGKNNSR